MRHQVCERFRAVRVIISLHTTGVGSEVGHSLPQQVNNFLRWSFQMLLSAERLKRTAMTSLSCESRDPQLQLQLQLQPAQQHSEARTESQLRVWQISSCGDKQTLLSSSTVSSGVMNSNVKMSDRGTENSRS